MQFITVHAKFLETVKSDRFNRINYCNVSILEFIVKLLIPRNVFFIPFSYRLCQYSWWKDYNMIIFLGTLTITCIQRFRQNQANETVYRRKVQGSITTDWASSHYWSQRYTPRIIVQYQSTLSTFSTYKFNTLFLPPRNEELLQLYPPEQLRLTCCFGLECLLKPFLHWAKLAKLREPVFKFVCATLLIKSKKRTCL